MTSRRSIRALVALVAATALAATAASCSKAEDKGDISDQLYKEDVTLVWWHNASAPGKGKDLWEKLARDFEALHPTVTIEVVPIETNDLQRNRLPAALLSGEAPDLFQSWGGGEMREFVDSDYLMDITDYTKELVEAVGPEAENWAVDGRQYGLPYNFGAEGFWYNKDLFAQAGIEDTPKTLDELNAAVEKLKAIDVVPIAVGAGDAWPAGHWWYNFAIHECPAEVIDQANFEDPCLIKAGEDLKAFVDTEPFQPNLLETPGQTGVGSSAGMVANGQAAMELMGHWNAGVIGGLTEDGEVPEFLGWFPFPDLPGTARPQAVLGGGDGFSCYKDAPLECVEFLKFLLTVENQKAFAETGAGIPVVAGSETAITDPSLKAISDAVAAAPSVSLWLDTKFGAQTGTPMNEAIVAIFAGTGTPEGVVEALRKAASR